MIRTYSELISLHSFEERFRYLQLHGKVGKETFGFDRYLYQQFLRSGEWADIRDEIILRDHARDLGIPGREINERILIHHMNPVTKADVLTMSDRLLNPEYLICTTKCTHDAIHYGDGSLLIPEPIVRSPNDTCPWK